MYENSRYPYLYETHVHTSEGSACARSSGEEIALAYKKAGYTGIIVTDHNWGGNTAIDRKLPWEEYVQGFCRGYEEAKRTGDEIGLQVFFGWEAGYHGTEFLIYGLDKTWLLNHPEIRTASIPEQFRLVSLYNGIVVHAHPFREENYIPEIRLYPEYVHAVEAVNACHSNPASIAHYDSSYNEKALRYAAEHHLPCTAGSDAHRVAPFLGGGMAFTRPLYTIHDFIQAVMGGEPRILTDGVKLYE